MKTILPSKTLAVATLALCAALSPGARAGTPEEDLAAARPVIDAANADWIPALEAQDARRAVAPFADDAMFILGDGKTIAGRAAIEAFIAERFAPGSKVTGGTIQQDGIQSIRDGLIYEWGHGGTTRVDAKGETHSSSGPYLTVWRRNPSGQWQIVRNLTF
ncbi:uncharacterized protein (TIGR02246 family) [Inquilinus ginsengisoli]|uniref:Uncharacterized protein (TIGR02246 family) n=1 Tax=Inquilinus ginsengisoli TaxID=363840 RepID=A0ABU1JW42_9PROT|nr:SgcJ/EcaC family oxidoreductase [Inquilinus ginsengisoli]MDR6292846.1 uncharacterized protein (TIGR02246 family) [Inquilinus ginsengisoli]